MVDFFIGKFIEEANERNKKKLLLASIIVNLGLLAFFKYYNFFIDSWIDLFKSIGYNSPNNLYLNIILPVGISFYTFQTMSYTIDIYKGKIKSNKEFISFAAYVSFFPQLVAGPIERASSLLPQLTKKRIFHSEQISVGFQLILWGLFKKVVIGDNLSVGVDKVFSEYHLFDGGTLLLTLFLFSFQIYCDFSGYSDIAIGISKTLGIELKSNFKFPYFSRNIGEFWRRWHISLSTWFRDYIYFPIGGSRHGKLRSILNIFIIFLVSGFWHGANWTFVFWGLIHAMLFIPGFIFNFNRNYLGTIAQNKFFPNFREIFQMVYLFIVVSITWTFFRSNSISDAFHYLEIILTNFSITNIQNKYYIIFVFILVLIEWFMRNDERHPFKINNSFLRWCVYLIITYSIFIELQLINSNSFIYFQF